jgi:hypothetical protein
MLQSQVKPCLEIFSQPCWGHAMSPKTTARASGLELRDGQSVDALERDGTVIALDLSHTDTDLVAEEVVCAE